MSLKANTIFLAKHISFFQFKDIGLQRLTRILKICMVLAFASFTCTINESKILDMRDGLSVSIVSITNIDSLTVKQDSLSYSRYRVQFKLDSVLVGLKPPKSYEFDLALNTNKFLDYCTKSISDFNLEVEPIFLIYHQSKIIRFLKKHGNEIKVDEYVQRQLLLAP